MPSLKFFKYQGAGNDFIMLDFMNRQVEMDVSLVSHLCDRRFGIGADGLITISPSDKGDFKMRYYNSDGHEASFCGNGSRCAVAFAHDLNIIGSSADFEAFDGMHHGEILSDHDGEKTVSITMRDVNIHHTNGDFLVIDTGSPHFITEVPDPDKIDVRAEGRKIRNDKSISEDGVNVNFINWDGKLLFIRTYERGVEDETLACGTGITASVIATAYWHGANHIDVKAKGGDLHVDLERHGDLFENIVLTGPARLSFSGDIQA